MGKKEAKKKAKARDAARLKKINAERKASGAAPTPGAASTPALTPGLDTELENRIVELEKEAGKLLWLRSRLRLRSAPDWPPAISARKRNSTIPCRCGAARCAGDAGV